MPPQVSILSLLVILKTALSISLWVILSFSADILSVSEFLLYTLFIFQKQLPRVGLIVFSNLYTYVSLLSRNRLLLCFEQMHDLLLFGFFGFTYPLSFKGNDVCKYNTIYILLYFRHQY